MINFKFVLVSILGLAAVLFCGLGLLVEATPKIHHATVLEKPIEMVASNASKRRQGPEVEKDVWEAISRKFVPKSPIPDVSYLLHHVANWQGFSYPRGVASDLDHETIKSILIDGAKCPAYVPKVPLLYLDFSGRPALAHEGMEGVESHPQQVLATLGMMGLPSSTSLRSEETKTTIADLILRVQDHFVLEGEIEWTVMALALYSPTSKVFTNQWGQKFSFEEIAKRLLDRELRTGACVGTHTLQALAVLLQVNSQNRLFDRQTESLIVGHLQLALARLNSSQNPQGYWTPDWPFPLADESTQKYDRRIFSEQSLAQATGHHLEWIELLPDSIIVDEAMFTRAQTWALRTLDKIETISNDRLCPYSHCFRAVRKHLILRESVEKGI